MRKRDSDDCTVQHIFNGVVVHDFYHTSMTACQPTPDADTDSTAAYLALAAEEVKQAIAHLETACADSRVDASVRRVALDALRDALTAIEAEMEQANAQP